MPSVFQAGSSTCRRQHVEVGEDLCGSWEIAVGTTVMIVLVILCGTYYLES